MHYNSLINSPGWNWYPFQFLQIPSPPLQDLKRARVRTKHELRTSFWFSSHPACPLQLDLTLWGCSWTSISLPDQNAATFPVCSVKGPDGADGTSRFKGGRLKPHLAGCWPLFLWLNVSKQNVLSFISSCISAFCPGTKLCVGMLWTSAFWFECLELMYLIFFPLRIQEPWLEVMFVALMCFRSSQVTLRWLFLSLCDWLLFQVWCSGATPERKSPKQRGYMPLRMRTQDKANTRLCSPQRSQQCQIMQPRKKKNHSLFLRKNQRAALILPPH